MAKVPVSVQRHRTGIPAQINVRQLGAEARCQFASLLCERIFKIVNITPVLSGRVAHQQHRPIYTLRENSASHA